MSDRYYVACDLGAESGRVILGTLADGRVQLEEMHRFPNGAVEIQGTLRWNVIDLYQQMKQGLRKVASRGVPIAGISVDTWGVDYVLFNDRQPLLLLPYHYRDARNERYYADVLKEVGHEKIFSETGIQFMALNTLYQLVATTRENQELVNQADMFLPMGDYFHYLFCGVAKSEVSSASTTQLYNPVTNRWSDKLIQQVGLPEKMFPEIVPSGTRLGQLSAQLSAETGLTEVEVIATCSHDTGAAVAAVPATGDQWAYLSSGTWSLIGVELPSPLISEEARQQNFTNEAGFGGTTRFLKNIIGLWLLQESRRVWERQGQQLDYAEINQLAAEAEPFRSLIYPNDPRFMKPDDMLQAIASFCRESNQPVPESPGQFARCILESLALLYAQCLGMLEQLTDRKISQLHIVGGGSQSELLNQFAASASDRTVLAGPVEATAIGNLLIQAIAMGQLDSLADLRAVVKNSFSINEFQPQDPDLWQEASKRFAKLASLIA